MMRVWRGQYLEMHVSGTWEYAARIGATGAAVILAVTPEGEIVLVEQYRHAFGAPCIELPAGLIGDTSDDDTGEAAARRELEEETGFTAETFEDLGTYATSPGMSSELFTLFRAHGLKRVGAGGGVAGEDITPHVVPMAELPGFLDGQRQQGRIIDSRLTIALGLA
ncbi:MAG: NUDIX hydrolase [Polymorphobacter sp.]|uniref:NUDIX hydrolase n=1 Tax=Polymorphobacter sp. TaxID=1909290 RepID=UPI003A86A615